jgi:hypothetical protein
VPDGPRVVRAEREVLIEERTLIRHVVPVVLVRLGESTQAESAADHHLVAARERTQQAVRSLGIPGKSKGGLRRDMPWSISASPRHQHWIGIATQRSRVEKIANRRRPVHRAWVRVMIRAGLVGALPGEIPTQPVVHRQRGRNAIRVLCEKSPGQGGLIERIAAHGPGLRVLPGGRAVRVGSSHAVDAAGQRCIEIQCLR